MKTQAQIEEKVHQLERIRPNDMSADAPISVQVEAAKLRKSIDDKLAILRWVLKDELG